MTPKDFEALVLQGKRLLEAMGTCIGQTETEDEADKLMEIIVKNLPDGLAEKIWDHYVDWENVEWMVEWGKSQGGHP